VAAVTEVRSFEQLFRDQYAPLVALGAWLTGDRSVGEDLAQEALGATHRRWHEVATYDQPAAFTRRTLINLASNERRRRGRERRALGRVSALAAPSPAAGPPGDDPQLWAEVAALPLRQRAAIGLRYLEDLGAADIAEALGCSEATVRVHLYRAHRRLADRLQARAVEPVADVEGSSP
jgi:DNA-directed RNA polymerase specialized sigma24 family protein